VKKVMVFKHGLGFTGCEHRGHHAKERCHISVKTFVGLNESQLTCGD